MPGRTGGAGFCSPGSQASSLRCPKGTVGEGNMFAWLGRACCCTTIFFPLKSGVYSHREVTDVSKSRCRPALPWERGFAAPERGHGQGETFTEPFPLQPSPGRRHRATRATSILRARSHKPTCASSGDPVARKMNCSNPFSSKKVPSGRRARPAPRNAQLQAETTPPATHVEVDGEEKCYLWHIAPLCAIRSFFWLEIPFRLRRGVLRRASNRAHAGRLLPESPHRRLQPVFSFDA